MPVWTAGTAVLLSVADAVTTVMTTMTMMPATVVIPGCCPYSLGTGAAAMGMSSAAPVTVRLIDRGACRACLI